MSLKNKVKSLKKSVEKIANSKVNGFFFVDIVEKEYFIRAPGNKTKFQGNREEYEDYIGKYENAIFIMDDIPRKPGEPLLSEWTM
jgi:hypothetical protein